MNIGKAKIDIDSRGCHFCGTEWSDAWEIYRNIKVSILDSVFMVPVHICGDCIRKRGFQPSLELDELSVDPASQPQVADEQLEFEESEV